MPAPWHAAGPAFPEHGDAQSTPPMRALCASARAPPVARTLDARDTHATTAPQRLVGSDIRRQQGHRRRYHRWCKEQIGSCSFQTKRPASRSRSSDAPPKDNTYVWSTPARTDNPLLLQAVGTISADLGRPKGFVPLFTTGPYPIDGWLSFCTRRVRLPHHNHFVTTIYYSATR